MRVVRDQTPHSPVATAESGTRRAKLPVSLSILYSPSADHNTASNKNGWCVSLHSLLILFRRCISYFLCLDINAPACPLQSPSRLLTTRTATGYARLPHRIRHVRRFHCVDMCSVPSRCSQKTYPTKGKTVTVDYVGAQARTGALLAHEAPSDFLPKRQARCWTGLCSILPARTAGSSPSRSAWRATRLLRTRSFATCSALCSALCFPTLGAASRP